MNLCRHTIQESLLRRILKLVPMESLQAIYEYLVESHPLAIPLQIGLHTGLRVSKVSGLF